jgi:hypothetical protein
MGVPPYEKYCWQLNGANEEKNGIIFSHLKPIPLVIQHVKMVLW